MPTAHLLIPTTAEPYIYDNHRILGHVTSSATTFMWFKHEIYGKIGQSWSHIVITGEDTASANRLARYQADRVLSGLHPCYVKEA